MFRYSCTIAMTLGTAVLFTVGAGQASAQRAAVSEESDRPNRSSTSPRVTYYEAPTDVREARVPVTNYYSPRVTYYDAPVTSYTPRVTYYDAPVTSYAPRVTYYDAPVTSYAPRVTYYDAPVVSYAPPVVTYSPAPVSVTRYGLLGRPRQTVTYYR